MPRGNDYPLDSRLRAARGQPADRPTSTDGVGGDSPTGAIEDMTGPGRIEPDGTADAAAEGDAEALRHEEQEQQG